MKAAPNGAGWVRRILAGALLLAAACSQGGNEAAPAAKVNADSGAVSERVNKLTYHYNAQRTGWNDRETVLTRESVAADDFGALWSSPKFDSVDGMEPRLFASPLYVDHVGITSGEHAGSAGPVVYAASHHGFVYAVSAFEGGGVAKGDILWRKRLVNIGCGGRGKGLISTPVIDLERSRIYVVVCESPSTEGDDRGEHRYTAHALDFGSGEETQGWPVEISRETVSDPGLNNNGETIFPPGGHFVQRGALNLSPDGSRLYVPFGGDRHSGWLVSVDTTKPGVASAFSSTPRTEEHQGGMWASGGPSVDPQGRIHIATGANYMVDVEKRGQTGIYPHSPNNWGFSILQFTEDREDGLELTGTYTPFDYCTAQTADIDIGSSGTFVIDLDPAMTATPRLVVLLGGKGGNAYLLNRDNMPGSLEQRQACNADPESDGSLFGPDIQPQFGTPGFLNIFGPYSDQWGRRDLAKSRTTGAYFRKDGEHYLFSTGASKERVNSTVSVPPGLVQLKLVTEPGEPAFLRIDQSEMTLAFKNVGSPVVTSNGEEDAIVWVMDLNATRATSVWDEEAPPQPVLYALDAMTLDILWRSPPGALHPTGKYNEPTVANGVVYVGTDRIQAFGPGADPARQVAADSEEGFVSLFDGETLEGWRGDPRYWSVRDGAITGEYGERIPQHSFIIHEDVYENFELRLKYRLLTEQSNSGVLFRSREDPERPYGALGYQANVVPPEKDADFSKLWDEQGRGLMAFLGEEIVMTRTGDGPVREVISALDGEADTNKVAKPYPEWNEMTVIAYGNRSYHGVNGYLAVVATDEDEEARWMEGSFGMQISRGPPMGIQFKDIRVKEIDSLPDIENRFRPFPVVEKIDPALAARAPEIFAARCAACHTATPAPGTPSRGELAQMPRDAIVRSLRGGIMAPEAQGLSVDEIEALAAHVIGEMR